MPRLANGHWRSRASWQRWSWASACQYRTGCLSPLRWHISKLFVRAVALLRVRPRWPWQPRRPHGSRLPSARSAWTPHGKCGSSVGTRSAVGTVQCSWSRHTRHALPVASPSPSALRARCWEPSRSLPRPRRSSSGPQMEVQLGSWAAVAAVAVGAVGVVALAGVLDQRQCTVREHLLRVHVHTRVASAQFDHVVRSQQRPVLAVSVRL